jgi:hypothetical protein
LFGLAGCQQDSNSLLGWYLLKVGGVEVSRSIPGTVQAAVGGSQALSITFSTNERQALTNLQVTSGLSSLPSGWSGPARCHLEDRAEPVGGLIQGIDGNFYGTTSGGGASNAGTIFVVLLH